MGAWSTSITGNDTAQDLKYEYQAAFLYNDVDTALAKIDRYVRRNFNESDEEEWCDYYYSLADFMWKHGILTDAVRDRAVQMIDTGFGLELWEESGTKILEKRKKVLAEFRAKLQSPQPPKKKIQVKLYLHPIFEPGDLIAIQLQTANKHYLKHCCVTEDDFRGFDGKYVVLRKVTDHVSYASAIEPRLKDHWAVFQLYGKIFDTCPTAEDLKTVTWADPDKQRRKSQWAHLIDSKGNGTFISESSMFYFRKRNYVVIGNSRAGLPKTYSRNTHLFIGINSPYANTDTDLINTILK